MELKKMSAAQLAGFLCNGSALLEIKKEEVNALNIFPVPDGDTGTNMFLTINSAVKNIKADQHQDIAHVMQDFSMGALMGARGNSGVILSQMFRGFGQSISGKDELTAIDFAKALQKGVDLSYKSVMKPVEGTILTVFKDFAAAAISYAKEDDDIIAMLEASLAAGEKSLANTPNILPVLKQAGVVDAGGKGILIIFEGGLHYLKGQESLEQHISAGTIKEDKIAASAINDLSDIVYAYCTELLIKGHDLPAEEIRARLSQEPEGDSLLVVGTQDMIKIHIHTNDPGNVLQYATEWGSLHDIKIENMRDQYEDLPKEDSAGKIQGEDSNKSVSAVLAVCSGDGIAEIFGSMGAFVLEGGQTMNPSAEEILNSVNNIAAEEIIILPNNKNIILAAQQAQKLIDKPVYVVESKFITQGLASMMAFNPDEHADAIFEEMKEAAQAIKSAEITYAVRKSNYDGIDIEKDDILALSEGKIAANGKELLPTLLRLLDQIIDNENDNIITLFYGNDLSEQQAQEAVAAVQEKFPHIEVDYYYGGQPLYYFLISIE
ncbi:MAG: DAK2 domain-containing protein [Bacillota bacterium]